MVTAPLIIMTRCKHLAHHLDCETPSHITVHQSPTADESDIEITFPTTHVQGYYPKGAISCGTFFYILDMLLKGCIEFEDHIE